MSEMIERVARTIHASRFRTLMQKEPPPFEELERSDADEWRQAARAAIEAMREPTRGMLNAAVDATGAGSGMSWVNRSPQTLFEQGHRAMIDATLSKDSDHA